MPALTVTTTLYSVRTTEQRMRITETVVAPLARFVQDLVGRLVGLCLPLVGKQTRTICERQTIWSTSKTLRVLVVRPTTTLVHVSIADGREGTATVTDSVLGHRRSLLTRVLMKTCFVNG